MPLVKWWIKNARRAVLVLAPEGLWINSTDTYDY
jgi:hypothetical protein